MAIMSGWNGLDCMAMHDMSPPSLGPVTGAAGWATASRSLSRIWPMKGDADRQMAARVAQAEKILGRPLPKEATKASSQSAKAGSGLAKLVQAIVDGYEAGERGEALEILARRHIASQGGKARALKLSPARLSELGRKGGRPRRVG